VLSHVDAGARIVSADLDIAASDEIVAQVAERDGALFWLTALSRFRADEPSSSRSVRRDRFRP
jgi:hypothetical protein